MKRRADTTRESAPARLYVVAAWVPAADWVAVGALGELRLQRGWHVYVGSARRGRAARVARHARAGKRLRWHADYVFSACPARLAWLVDGPPGATECELAAALAAAPGGGRDHRRFGASDCGCAGHLLRFASQAALRGALAEAERRELRVEPYRVQRGARALRAGGRDGAGCGPPARPASPAGVTGTLRPKGSRLSSGIPWRAY